MKKFLKHTIPALLLAVSIPAQAWDVTAKVSKIEPSYMPERTQFLLDAPAGTCTVDWI